MPFGLVTEGEQWMFNEIEKYAGILNGLRTSIAETLRYNHPDLDVAADELLKAIRKSRRSLREYADINLKRNYPGYRDDHPEEAAQWDERQDVLRLRWLDGIQEAMGWVNPLIAEYGRASAEEAG